jgi:hypothetical protein
MESTLDLLQSTSVGHSADVEMFLHIGNDSYPVLQSGGVEIKLKDASVVPSGNGILEIVIDGRSDRREVRVLDGSGDSNWRRIESR